MRRLLLAAAAAAAFLVPSAARACDLSNCVPGVPVCDLAPCQVCFNHEYDRWCIPAE